MLSVVNRKKFQGIIKLVVDRTLVFVIIVAFPLVLQAQMSSTNYQINFDSINIGGDRSESANYGITDSIGQNSSGYSNSSNYRLSAGFQQVDDYPITLTTGGDITLPNLSGITANSSSGTTTAAVDTASPRGYQLTIKANTSPAMQGPSSENFADYNPTGSNPDLNFTLASGENEFGYTVSGDNVPSRFKHNGSSCNSGSTSSTTTCWEGLTLSDAQIAVSSSATTAGGDSIDIVFQAGIGSNVIKPAGSYNATVVLTATSL